MIFIIYFFAGLIVLAGLLLIVNPDFFFNFLNKNSGKFWIYLAAIVVRIIIGVLLIVTSGYSKFPLVISVLGWIVVLAAIILLAIGRRKFEKMVSWIISIFKPYGRIGGLFSVAFGLLLIYAYN